MAFKASIVSQKNKSYKIEVKQGNVSYFFYRSYRGVDKIVQDMQALENMINDGPKKADLDNKSKKNKDEKNLKAITKLIQDVFNSIAITQPASTNYTQTQLDNMKTKIQSAVNSFIGGL